MYLPGQDFFANACLTKDKDRSIRLGCVAGLLEDMHISRAVVVCYPFDFRNNEVHAGSLLYLELMPLQAEQAGQLPFYQGNQGVHIGRAHAYECAGYIMAFQQEEERFLIGQVDAQAKEYLVV